MSQKPRADDDTLNRLLAGDDGISRQEGEEMLGKVLPPKKRTSFFKTWRFLVPVAATAALLLIFRDEEFSPRGKGGSNLRAACHLVANEPIDATCNPGDSLRFEVESRRPFVALFIQLPDGTISWVTTGLAVPKERGWLSLSAEVEDARGSHLVFAVFSDTALDRDAVKRALDTSEVETLRRRIDVAKP